jgi:tRNA(adenine34) deaminase
MALPAHMQFALEEARAAQARGEVPVGCVIVRGDKVVARAGNHTLGLTDPTAHAELLAIRQAAAALGTERLADCDLYVTLEPCAMCAAAMSFGRIRKRRAVFCLVDLPSPARSLWRHQRKRLRRAAA